MSHPEVLLVEVLVDGVQYAHQGLTDRVWTVTNAGDGPVLTPVTDPDQELLACLRMESARRFLSLPVDESLLARQAAATWATLLPSAEVVLHGAPRPPTGTDQEILEAVRQRAAELPTHPRIAEVLEQLEQLPAGIGPCHTDLAETANEWDLEWCCPESLPARTADIFGAPRLSVFFDRVEFSVAAAGPPGRIPSPDALSASLWHTELDEPVVQAMLNYNTSEHVFRGSGARWPTEPDLLVDRWWGHANLVLDIAGADQLEPLPRDLAHEKAWRGWRAYNRARRRALDRWLAGEDPGEALTVAEKAWAVTRPRIRVAFDTAAGLLDRVDLGLLGDGYASIHPSWPLVDALSADRVDGDALRRVAVVETYGRAAGLPDRGSERQAWTVDRALAYAAAGDLLTARECLATSWTWLRNAARRLTDTRSPAAVERLVAYAARCAAELVDDPEHARQLRDQAHTLETGGPVTRALEAVTAAAAQTPIRAARGRPDRAEVRQFAAAAWVAARRAAAWHAGTGDPSPALDAAADRAVAAPGTYASVHESDEVAALREYRSGLTRLHADAPLLAEFVVLFGVK